MGERGRIAATRGKTDRELLEALVGGHNALHDCIDEFRVEQKGVNTTVATAMDHVVREVGTLKVAQSFDSNRITALSQRLGVDPVAAPTSVKPAVGAWSIKKMIAVGLPLVSSIVLVLQISIPVVVAAAKAGYTAIMAAH